ncbi:hypothetical protein LAWI1_G008085 [Lachnellula willkommii]|uniref:Uncharacterized protein n=1 Tax=Lachnellula willkommii TaxID=215461 RepID=A0A559M156_9HELO|nr:hypothetical protein LAWI1_G008085 [Lachnellula willkommii]
MPSLNNRNIRVRLKKSTTPIYRGAKYKIAFTPKKLEIIYLSKKCHDYSLVYIINKRLTIELIITIEKEGN